MYPNEYKQEAKLLFSNGNFKKASVLFEKDAKTDPNNEEVYFYLGRCYENLFYESKAIEVYLHGLNLCSNPEHISDYNLNIGNCYIKLANPEKALFYYTQSECFPSNQASARLGKAHAYLCLRDYESALNIYNKLYACGFPREKINHHIEFCYFKLNNKR